jgi:hypothetical protein
MLQYVLLFALAAGSGPSASRLAGVPAGAPPERSAAAAPSGPRLQVEKLVQDAGMVAPGPQLRFVFPMRNTGTTPLEITRVNPGCHCLSAEYDRHLAPGARGTICIVFDTAGRRGIIEKHITVESTDPDTPRLGLTVKAVLHEVVEVTPGEDVTLPLDSGASAEQELILRSYEKKPLEVTRVVCSSPTTEARMLDRDQIALRVPGDATKYQIVQLTFPASVAEKAFDETVTIHTNSPGRPKVTVHLYGVPRSAVTASPPHLYFGAVATTGGEPTMRVISLFRRHGGFKVVGVDAPDAHLRVIINPDPSGTLCDVVVTYSSGWTPGTVEGTITIHTDDPQRPTIVVPYTADVSSTASPA